MKACALLLVLFFYGQLWGSCPAQSGQPLPAYVQADPQGPEGTHPYKHVWSSYHQWDLGFALTGGAFNNLSPSVSSSGAFGVELLGDYNVTRQLQIEAGINFSDSTISPTGYYYTGYYWTNYQLSATLAQTDFFIGPKYRLLKYSKLSPVVGMVVDYETRGLTEPGYSYNINFTNIPLSSFSIGPDVGLDLKLDRNTNMGIDFKEFFPNQGPSYFIGGLYLKFAF